MITIALARSVREKGEAGKKVAMYQGIAVYQDTTAKTKHGAIVAPSATPIPFKIAKHMFFVEKWLRIDRPYNAPKTLPHITPGIMKINN